jgi:hypothetical protein
MKQLLLLTTVIVMILSVTMVASAQTLSQANTRDEEVVTTYWTGDRGEFEFPTRVYTKDGERDGFTVWHTTESGGKISMVGALVGPRTKVTVLNRTLTKASLDLLSGKQVAVTAKIRQVGVDRGEASQSVRYCEELTIVVIDDPWR